MNLFTLIYKQMELKSKMKEQKVEIKQWIPEPLYDYDVPQFQIPEVRSKKCTRERLSKVLAFINMNKQRRFAHCCTIMPIPTTEKRFLSITGSVANSANLIKFMIQLGLIQLYDSSYQFNAYYDEDNHSRRYLYFIENEKLLIEYAQKNNINVYEVSNKRTIYKKFKIPSFDHNKVRIGKVSLLKPDNFSVREFEDYVECVLRENYPKLEYYQDLADRINKDYYSDLPDFQIRYRVNFDWDKGNKAITNIGLRATNSYVSAKKEDDNPSYKGLLKKDILNRYELNLEKDVKSSVPRVTKSLNSGYWISEDIDIYRDVYEMIYNREQYIKSSNSDENWVEMREALKALHLRAYFDELSRLGSNTCRSMYEVEDRDAVYRAMIDYRDAIELVEGYIYGSEIFYHESNIYMEVTKHLLEDGYFVWQVYDSWYARKEGVTQEQFEEYTTNLVEEIANKYIEELEEL